MAPPALPSDKIRHVLFGLRFIQQPCIITTGSIALYFAYWHYKLIDPVPLPLSILIFGCTAAYIQSHLFIIDPLLQTYSLLLKTCAPGTIFLTVGYGTLFTISGIRAPQSDYFSPFRETQGWKLADADIEEQHKTLVIALLVVGAIAVLSTLAVTGIGAHGVWKQRRSGSGRGGYAVLGVDGDREGSDDGEIEMEGGFAMKML